MRPSTVARIQSRGGVLYCSPLVVPSRCLQRLPATSRLHFGHQSDEVNGQRTSEPVEVDESDIAEAALDVADVGRVESGPFGQMLLG